ALDDLEGRIASIPETALSKDPLEAGDLSGIDYIGLRDSLVRLSYFGIAGAFPKIALLPEIPADPTPEEALRLLRARQALIEQAMLSHQHGRDRLAEAVALSSFSQLPPDELNRLNAEQKADILQRAAALILGNAFRLVPTFNFGNAAEIA